MNNKTSVVAVVLGIVALLTAGFAALRAPSQTVVQQPSQSFGALAGPDIPSPYLQWGGVVDWRTQTPFASATSSTCVIRIPPTSTSTLVRFTAQPTVSTSTDRLYALATSTVPYAPGGGVATTSLIATVIIPANSQAGMMWLPQASANPGALGSTNSTSTAVASFVANPYVAGQISTTSATYLILYQRGGGLRSDDANSGATPTGSCTAVFQKL